MKSYAPTALFLFLLAGLPLWAQSNDIQPVLTPQDFPVLSDWFDQAGANRTCNGSEILIDTNTTVDLNAQTPVVQGDPDLTPFFSYQKSGDDPTTWKAVFDLGARGLRIAPGVTLTVTNVAVSTGSAAPGLEIRTTCDVTIQGSIRLEAANAGTGNLTIISAGNITTSGTVFNGIQGNMGVAGILTMASGDDLRLEPSGMIQLKGSQQGGRGLNLLTFHTDGDLDLAGQVEAGFDYSLSPYLNLAAFRGGVRIDGSHLLSTNQWGERITSGVRLRSNAGYAVGDMKIVAHNDIHVTGYGGGQWGGQDSATFLLDKSARNGGAVVPTTLTLTNSAPDSVRVDVSIPAGSGAIKGVYGNLFNQSQLNDMTFSGSDLSDNRFLIADGVDGISGYWMSPPGGWDFGLGIGSGDDTITSTSFTITGSGLSLEQLLVGQRDFQALGVIIATSPDQAGKDNSLVRMAMPSPYFAAGRQEGTVAVKNKGTSRGGNLTVQSLAGNIMGSDHAFDTAAGDNADKILTLAAARDITLSISDPRTAAMFGPQPVLDSRGQGGANRLQSTAGGITVGPGARLWSGASNQLSACSGVTLNGDALPADADTSDDSGICPPPLELAVSTPNQDAVLNQTLVTVSGTITPESAGVTVNGVLATVENGAWSLDLTLEQGPQTITVNAVDSGRTTSITRNITVDSMAPVITLNGPNSIIQGETLELDWTVSDASPVTAQLLRDGNLISSEPSGAHSFVVPLDPDLTELVYTLTAQDNAGNAASPTELRIAVTPPNLRLSFSSPAPNTLTNSDTISVAGEVFPADTPVTVAGINAQVSGEAWTAQIPLTDEGTITLTASAVLGAQNTQAVLTLIRDITAPVLTLNAPQRALPGTSFNLSWSAADSHSLGSTTLSRDGVQISDQPSGNLDISIPADNPAIRTQFDLSAVDAAGNSSSAQVTVSLIDPADLDPVVITITSPSHNQQFSAGAVTIQGSVSPADANLSLRGAAVTTDAGGAFSLNTTLNSGLNTYLFRATASDNRPGSAKLDLFLDDIDPQVNVISPATGFKTNQPTVTIQGAVLDQYDTSPTLTREGGDIPVVAGRFSEDIQLTPGDNTLTYTATDAVGRSSTTTVTIDYRDQGPEINLEHPSRIRPGEGFDLTVSFPTPQDIERAEVYVNHKSLVSQQNGDSSTTSVPPVSGIRQIPILVTATDVYGNRTESQGSVTISFPHHVYGKVLDDTTSYPLGGIPVTITTPLSQTEQVTDEDGGYRAYVQGYPVEVAVATSAYAPIQRHMPVEVSSWRTPDLRLTPQGVSGAAPGVLTHNGLQLTLGGGLSGNGRLTRYHSQGIPQLLPLGYAPLTAFNLSGVSGTGTIDIQMDAPSPSGDVLLLRLDNDAWTLVQILSTGPSYRITMGTAGAWMLAVSDSSPAVGASLKRQRDQVVPPNTLADALTDPSYVSIRDEPQTQFTLILQSGATLNSGVRAALTAEEVHTRFSETIVVPDYQLDFFAYSTGYDSGSLGGSVNIRARQEVLPDLTREAQITFTGKAGHTDTAGFLDNPIQQLGNLNLDFTDTAAQPRVVHVEQIALIPPVTPGAQQLAAFEMVVGGSLDQAPQISLEAPQSAAVILLLEQGDAWQYAGRLTYSDGVWRNTATTALLQSGRYLALALDYAVTEVSGIITHSGAPTADAEISIAAMSWHARSNNNGEYRIAVPRTDQSQTLRAQHNGIRREGSRVLTSTAGNDSLSGQDMVLGPRDFRLLRHQPEADQRHVAVMPTLILEFNRSVSNDTGLLASSIRLNAGADVPIDIIAEPGRRTLRVLPLAALPNATTCTLSIAAGLTSQAGDPLNAATDFSFTTRAASVPSQLDLGGFYLSEDNGALNLRAESENLVAGTVLRVFNPTNGSGFTTQLTTADFLHRIDAVPGDIIELNATDPAGNTHQRTIDLIRTAPNTYRLGSRPFSLRINPQLILHVDGIESGVGSEVSFTDAQPAAITAIASEVAVLANAPDLVPVQGVVAELVSGTFPRLSMRLQVEQNLAAFNGHGMMGMTFQRGVLAPPTLDSDVEEENTLMQIHDAVRIENGAAQTKRAGKSARKFGLLGMMISIEAAAISGTSPKPDPLGQQILIAVKATAAPMDEGGAATGDSFPVQDMVEVARANSNLQPPIPVPDYAWNRWHDFLPPNYHPVPGTPIYYPVLGIEGTVPAYSLVGVTDKTGRAQVAYFGAEPQALRGVDRVTGQISWAQIRSTDHAFHSSGSSLLTYSNRPLHFDPEAYSIELGAPPPPTLQSRWEAGRMQDDNFVIDAKQTLSLRLLNRVDVDPNMLLRLTIQSSQGIASSPEPNLSTQGMTQPNNPEISGQTVTWLFPPGVAQNGGVAQVTATIHGNHGTHNTITERFMIVAEGPLADIPGAAPFVLYSKPEHEQRDVLVGDAVLVAFSEPVSNITQDTVTLTNRFSGEQTPVVFYDQSGRIIQSVLAEATVLHMVPAEPLDFDQSFAISVDGVRDREGDPLETPFLANFTTAAFNAVDNLPVTYRTQVLGVKNLALVITEDSDQNHFTIDTYDTKDSYSVMDRVDSQEFTKGYEDAYVRAEIYLPEELSETGSGVAGDPNEYLEKIPGGSILVTVRQRFPADVSHIELFRHDGSKFERIFGYDSLEFGLCYDTAKMGKYIILAYKNFGYFDDEDIVPAKTVVMDVHKLVNDFNLGTASDRNDILEFERRTQEFGFVAKYPLPGDVSSVTAFTRKEFDGDFTSIKPAFLAAGFDHPAIYDFDLSVQPPYPGMAMPSGDPRFDARLIVRTEYPGGPSGFVQDTAAYPSFAYRDPQGGVREIDLAVFSERGPVNRILFFEVPRVPDVSSATIQPLKSLELPGGFFSFALDAETGLLAVQGLDRQFSVLNVKTFMETPAENDVAGFSHPAFLFDAVEKPLQELTFVNGNLYGHDSNSRTLTRTPISPKSYRAAGWEYFDLNEWMNPAGRTAVNADNLTKRVKFAKNMVFYATDLPMADGSRKFTMEQGSFALEIQGGGDIHISLQDLRQDITFDSISRDGLSGDSIERFAMTPIRDLYKSNSKRIELRQNGYDHYRLNWRIYKDGVQQAAGESEIMLVYRYPETRDMDPHRALEMVDALSLMPSIYSTDHQMSNNDGRLSIVPSRVYNSDYAFQPGIYGGGMLSGQMLYMAMPVWWDIQDLGDDAHDAAAAHARVVMEHPGQFQSVFKINDDGLAGTPLNNLVDSLELAGHSWRFTNQRNMLYQLGAMEKLPDFRALFQTMNRSAQQAAEMRFPVFRFTPPNAQTPPTLLGESTVVDVKDLRFNNHLKFQNGNGKTSPRPEFIKEFVNDFGGLRKNTLAYDSGPMGSRIVENKTADGLKITYEYDAEGYLIRVTQNDQRPVEYQWTEVLKLGDYSIKRLSQTIFGSGDDSEFVRFEYPSGSSFKLTGLRNNFGVKAMTVNRLDGLPSRVTLDSVGGPDGGVNFADAGGPWLSSGYDIGDLNFDVTWGAVRNGESTAWRKTGDGFRNRIMTYNPEGLLQTQQLDGVLNYAWTYQNAGPFWDQPTSYTDPLDNTFTIQTTTSGQVTSADGASSTVVYATSGAPVGSISVDGFRSGTQHSKFYMSYDGQNNLVSNGRPVRASVPGRAEAAATLQFNAFGDITATQTMGVSRRKSDFDSLGRARTITVLGGVEQTLDFAFQSNRQIITTRETGNDAVVREEFNEQGWLIRWQETIGDNVRYLNYEYDDLGRTTSVAGSHEAGFVYRAVYDDLTADPIRTFSPGEEMIYGKGPGGVITGITRIASGKTKSIPYETDLLGRTLVFEQPDVGVVRMTYDAFSRPLTRRKANDPTDPGITYQYGDKSLSVVDSYTQLNSQVQYADDSGWNDTTTVSGDGVDTPRTVTNTTSITNEGNGTGYRMALQTTGSGIPKTHHVDALGNTRGAAFGKYSFTAVDDSDNSFGQPQNFEGGWSETLGYDDFGRLTNVADAHGNQTSMSYDQHHRVSGGSNTRGQDFQLNYLNSIYEDTASFTVADKTLFQRADKHQTDFSDWMGVSSRNIQENLDQTLKVQRGQDGQGNPFEATYQYDDTGRLSSFEDFLGNTTAINWSNHGHTMTADLPNGQTWKVETDGYGELRKFDMGSGREIVISRDANDRVLKLDAPGRSYDFRYQGEDLTGINSAAGVVTFSQHNAQGMPTQVQIQDQGTVSLEYHAGGIPSQVIVRRNGLPPKILRTNTLGDLTYLKREYGEPIHYGYNQWGVINSIALGNNPPTQIFDENNPYTLTLPGGVSATLDDQVRIATITSAGLAPRELSYNANGGLAAVSMDGQVIETYTEVNDRLTQMTSGQGEYQDTTNFLYEDEGRLSTIENSLDGINRFEYPDDPEEPRHRVSRHTAPNGVTYNYVYDRFGNIIRIDLQNGPTFIYERDGSGNLTGVHVGGLSATLDDYQNGVPQTINWINEDGDTETLDLVTENGRPRSVIGAGFSLEIFWSQPPPDPAGDPETTPMILRVVRQGPGFRETWEPQYDAQERLVSTTITREDPDCVDCTATIIEETYGSPLNRLMGGLSRSVDGQNVVELINQFDDEADRQRINAQTDSGDGVSLEYDTFGNLTQTNYGENRRDLNYDGLRRLRRITTTVAEESSSENYRFDFQNRRISQDHPEIGEIVYAYHASRVIAIGVKVAGEINWTHAFGQGPAGPLFVKDLTYSGMDAFIFTDHLGTPFGWKQVATGEVFYTPYNPWGELLADHPGNTPLYGASGVPTEGFQLPPDPLFNMPPIGLGGHIYDQSTGLVYMHHRFYHPRLGHFTTADFRLPNIYDPTTFIETYAYAAGNPIMFRDPDGRSWLGDTIGGWFKNRVDVLEKTAKAFDDDNPFELVLSGVAGASALVVDIIGSTIQLADALVETSVETTLLTIDAAGLRGQSNARFALSELKAKVDTVRKVAQGISDLAAYAWDNPGAVVDKTAAVIEKAAEDWENKSLTEKIFHSTKLLGDIVTTVASGGATSANKLKRAGDALDTVVSAGRLHNKGHNKKDEEDRTKESDGEVCELSFPTPECFVAGTPILTKDGVRPIESIRPGELVAARDEQTGETYWMPVTAVGSRSARPIMSLTILSEDGVTETFEVTPQHPVWLEGRGWLLVSELEIGDLLAGYDGFWQVIDVHDTFTTADVYNFEVAYYHNYFAGEYGLWVHNAVSCEDRKLRRMATTPALRDMVNPPSKTGPHTDPALGAAFVADRLEADHVVSLHIIKSMPGFKNLTWENKLQVVRYRRNFIGLVKRSNASKGARSWTDWWGHKRSKTPVNPKFRAKMIKKERKLRGQLQLCIQELLADTTKQKEP